MTTKLSTVGERLAWIRDTLGVSYRELDAIAGVYRGVSYHTIKNGGNTASFVTLLSFAEGLGVDLMWLGTGRGKKPDLKDIWRNISNKLPSNNINNTVA